MRPTFDSVNENYNPLRETNDSRGRRKLTFRRGCRSISVDSFRRLTDERLTNVTARNETEWTGVRSAGTISILVNRANYDLLIQICSRLIEIAALLLGQSLSLVRLANTMKQICSDTYTYIDYI